jgi:dipeptidase D
MFSSSAVLAHFEKICRIPRCSKHEEKIRTYLRQWAGKEKFTAREDRLGNLLIQVPASPGRETDPTLVLQAHLDMVCEKEPESEHDFSHDPIRLRYDGDWLLAADTTLGADNGIGLALALAVAEDRELLHPPLELLFTVDEESGLTGAAGLEEGFFSGRILLNLDSEDEGVFTIGCAGGRDSELLLPLNYAPWSDKHHHCELKIDGLQGGHSGVDIDEERGNAIVLMARTLGVLRKSADFLLADLSGGSAHNAIPRQALARLAIVEGERQKLAARLDGWREVLSRSFPHEPGLTLSLSSITAPAAQVFSPGTTDKVIDLLLASPNGVMAMSKSVPGLVETSVNLATVRIIPGQLTLLFSQRSDQAAGLEWLTARLAALARLAGGRLVTGSGYPGWQPDPNSALLRRARQTYLNLFGTEPRIEVIHAGLECGLIGAKNPGLEMLSLGPTVKNPHTPREKLHLPSLNRFCRFLREILASFQ